MCSLQPMNYKALILSANGGYRVSPFPPEAGNEICLRLSLVPSSKVQRNKEVLKAVLARNERKSAREAVVQADVRQSSWGNTVVPLEIGERDFVEAEKVRRGLMSRRADELAL